MTYPARFTHLESARKRFGAKVDRLGPFLSKGDPSGDAAVEALSALPRTERERAIEKALADPGDRSVPEALRALVSEAEQLPLWWDPEWAAEGGQVLLRAGVAGGLVLGFKCLVGSYCSPAGNKPLIFSQRLEEDVLRRLAETGRFVRAMAEPEGLARSSKAFRAAFRVRLVHAQVRRFLRLSPKWDWAAWGMPINQADMSGTNLLFCNWFAEGLVQLGLSVTPAQHEALMHLWRGVGYVLGVDPELLPATVREAQVHAALLWATQDGPDEDSRRLARAFLEEPIRSAKTERERRNAQLSMPLRIALARELIGPELFDPLGFPPSPVQLGLPVIRQLIRVVGVGMRLNPFSEVISTKLGNAYWEAAVEQVLQHDPHVFGMPSQLPGLQ